MAHVLILGMTLSGKTYKAQMLAQAYKRAGIGVLVLDPLRDPRWVCDFITDDQDEFLDIFWRSKQCMGFFDEGEESVGRYDKAMNRTATRGRHWGHTCHYLAQGATQIAPVVRRQCTKLFAFCQSVDEGEVLAREWNRPELLEVSKLTQGQYIYAVKMGKIIDSRGNANGTISDNRGAVDDSGGSVGKRGAGPQKQGRQTSGKQDDTEGDPEGG